jgi:hypothetical protein
VDRHAVYALQISLFAPHALRDVTHGEATSRKFSGEKPSLHFGAPAAPFVDVIGHDEAETRLARGDPGDCASAHLILGIDGAVQPGLAHGAIAQCEM